MKQDHDYDGVYFIKGMFSLHQLGQFKKFGINALSMFHYIRLKQGLIPRNNPDHNKFSTWVLVDNANLQKWVGVHQSTKWEVLKKLESAKLIEVLRRGKGKCPKVRITCPEKLLN